MHAITSIFEKRYHAFEGGGGGDGKIWQGRKGKEDNCNYNLKTKIYKKMFIALLCSLHVP